MSVLKRLDLIESMLGINAQSVGEASNGVCVGKDDTDTALDGLLEATANLRRFTGPQNSQIWSPGVVKSLWLS